MAAVHAAVGVAAAVSVAAALLSQDLVLALPHGLRREDMAELVSTRVLVGPVLDRLEHVALDLDVVVAKRRVVEGSQNIVDDFVHRDVCVLPGVEDTTSTGQSCGGGK